MHLLTTCHNFCLLPGSKQQNFRPKVGNLHTRLTPNCSLVPVVFQSLPVSSLWIYVPNAPYLCCGVYSSVYFTCRISSSSIYAMGDVPFFSSLNDVPWYGYPDSTVPSPFTIYPPIGFMLIAFSFLRLSIRHFLQDRSCNCNDLHLTSGLPVATSK